MLTTKKSKRKKSAKRRATVSVRRNGKVIYGAAAKAVLKKRAAASRKRSTVKPVAKANPKRKPAKKAAKKNNVSKKRRTRRNAQSYSPDQPIKVTQYYRSGGPGYATARERIIRQGQRDLFAPDASMDQLLGFLRKNPTVIDAVRKKLGAKKFETASPSLLKKTMREVIAGARGKASTKSRKRPNSSRQRRRRNSSGELYETFTGQTHTQTDSVTAPSGAPRNLDELGDFVEFKWMDREGHRYTVNLEQQGIAAKLAGHQYADGRYELVLVSAPGAPLPYFGDYLPHGDHGHIYEVTYRAQKAHLGDTKPQLYYHKLGEESGVPPTLHINKDGELIFKGGEYWIESSGIHN